MIEIAEAVVVEVETVEVVVDEVIDDVAVEAVVVYRGLMNLFVVEINLHAQLRSPLTTLLSLLRPASEVLHQHVLL